MSDKHEIKITSKLDAFVCVLLIVDGWVLEWNQTNQRDETYKHRVIIDDPDKRTFRISKPTGKGYTLKNQERTVNHIWQYRKSIHQSGGIFRV